MQNRFCGLAVLSVLFTFGSLSVDAQTVGLGTPTIAQIPSPLSIEVSPSFDLPLADSANWFTFGGGMNLDMNYHLPSSIFFLTGGVQYAYVPDQASNSLSLVAARIGGGVQFPLTKGISVLGFAVGGYYLSTYNDFTASANDPYAAGGVEMKFSLGTSLSLNVGAEYDYYFGLYQGLSAAARSWNRPWQSWGQRRHTICRPSTCLPGVLQVLRRSSHRDPGAQEQPESPGRRISAPRFTSRSSWTPQKKSRFLAL